jgi:hypothetical protein
VEMNIRNQSNCRKGAAHFRDVQKVRSLSIKVENCSFYFFLSSNTITPLSSVEIAKQFLRCVLVQFAPNGLFPELFRPTLKVSILRFPTDSVMSTRKDLLHVLVLLAVCHVTSACFSSFGLNV